MPTDTIDKMNIKYVLLIAGISLGTAVGGGAGSVLTMPSRQSNEQVAKMTENAAITANEIVHIKEQLAELVKKVDESSRNNYSASDAARDRTSQTDLILKLLDKYERQADRITAVEKEIIQMKGRSNQ